MWTTGYNAFGQLGDGSTITRRYFRKVIKSAVRGMTAGLYHSMALKNTGYVLAVGWNKYGQFGNGFKTSRNRFVKVAETGDVVYINRNLMLPRDPITTRPPIAGVFPWSMPIYIP